jgi:hypothetical protein
MKALSKSLSLCVTLFAFCQILSVCSVCAQIIVDSKDLSPNEILTKSALVRYEEHIVPSRAMGEAVIKTETVVGLASFGKPILTTIKEEGMVIPHSITTRGDVYVVRFAVSFSGINIESIEQLSLNITAQEGIIALDLIPLKFDKEISITKNMSSPNIKLKYGETAVELGEFYKKQIVYKLLKPTIFASGLQESKFSWYMSDESINQGASQFIAILLVPKKEKSLHTILQAGARHKPTWFTGRHIVETPPVPVKIELKQ